MIPKAVEEAPQPQSINDHFVHHRDDPDFTKEKEEIKFGEINLGKKNFIFTPGANERLTKLYNYISAGVTVLLEGPTGTSKTLYSEIVCELLKAETIKLKIKESIPYAFIPCRHKTLVQ